MHARYSSLTQHSELASRPAHAPLLYKCCAVDYIKEENRLEIRKGEYVGKVVAKYTTAEGLVKRDDEDYDNTSVEIFSDGTDAPGEIFRYFLCHITWKRYLNSENAAINFCIHWITDQMITVPDLLQHSADLDTVFKKLHFLRPSIGIALVVDLMSTHYLKFKRIWEFQIDQYLTKCYFFSLNHFLFDFRAFTPPG